MDAGSVSVRSTAVLSTKGARADKDYEEWLISPQQIRLKRARLMARMEAQGPTWDREHILRLLSKLNQEGLNPVFDMMCLEHGYPSQVHGGGANG